VVPGINLTSLGARWTNNGAFAGCIHQLSVGEGGSHLMAGNMVFKHTATDCEQTPLFVGDIQLQWLPVVAPLAQLNAAGIVDAIRTDALPNAPLSLSPGGQAVVSIPLPPLGANAVVIRFTVSANATLAGPGNTVDFLQYTLASSVGTTFCEPGEAGVIGCPCANPPEGTLRGCNNSSNTGGAILSANGVASLDADSVVFTCVDEKPTATSIFLQGTTQIASGVAFGQGVRCVGGNLKRLYVKSAIGGTVRAPTGSDLSVSERSQALGDMILAGQNRFYLVYYRDPIVLGGCTSALTFNASAGLAISWTQ
jgi:hypothetical protein